MVRKARNTGYGMGVEFQLTYSVCYPILLTCLSYYDIVVFLTAIMVSCLLWNLQWLIIAYLVRSRLLSMTYKALHLWSQFNFNPIFPFLFYPTANVYFIYNVSLAPWTCFVILSWFFFCLCWYFLLEFFFLFHPVHIPMSYSSFKPNSSVTFLSPPT